MNNNAVSDGGVGHALGLPDAAMAALVALILLIILAAGLVGGYAAFLTQDRAATTDDPAPPPRGRFLLLGVVAAACVPLFLSLVRSGLIQAIINDKDPGRVEAFLIFTGLCLIAAFSARTFIDSLSRRVLRDLEDVKERQQQVAERVKQTEEIVDDQRAPAPPDRSDYAGSSLHDGIVPVATEHDRRILEALARKAYRTGGGVAEDVEMDRLQVNNRLLELVGMGLVSTLRSPKTGGERWAITPLGQAVLQR